MYMYTLLINFILYNSFLFVNLYIFKGFLTYIIRVQTGRSGMKGFLACIGWGLMFVCVFLMEGCSVGKIENIRLRDLDYTVVEEREIPEKLKESIEQHKSSPFQMVYESEGYLYIAKGYGEKETGGYSIGVQDLYLGKSSIYIQTRLIGPVNEDEMTPGVSYPYLVVKLEGYQEPVRFLT